MDLSSEADGGASRSVTNSLVLSATLGHAVHVASFRSYCTGLLLPGERKSVKPIAAGVKAGWVTTELVGLEWRDLRWQAKSGLGLSDEASRVDWGHNRFTCPQGAVSSSWTPSFDNRGTAVIKMKFFQRDCGKSVVCTPRQPEIG